MKSNQVSSTLTGPLGKVACTLTRTFPDVTAAASDVAASAAAMFLSSGLARRLICRWSRWILTVGTYAKGN
jgi:hypothetical protein